MGNLNYIYSSARTRVLETHLLKKETLLNMTAAETLEEALSVLSEGAGYASDVLTIKDSKDIKDFIDAEKKKLKKYASELFIEPKSFYAFIYLKKDLKKSYGLIIESESEFLKDFIKRFIDLYNIKTSLRLIYQKQGIEALKKNLIDGGYIRIEELVKLFGRPLDIFYAEITKESIKEIEENSNFSVFERKIEDYLITFMQPAKYMYFGPEAVFGFCFAKENELRQLELVLLAKINNIPKAEIQERITKSYV